MEMELTPIRCIHCESEPSLGRILSRWGVNSIVCSNSYCDGTMLSAVNPRALIYDWNKLNTPSEGPAHWRTYADND